MQLLSFPCATGRQWSPRLHRNNCQGQRLIFTSARYRLSLAGSAHHVNCGRSSVVKIRDRSVCSAMPPTNATSPRGGVRRASGKASIRPEREDWEDDWYLKRHIAKCVLMSNYASFLAADVVCEYVLKIKCKGSQNVRNLENPKTKFTRNGRNVAVLEEQPAATTDSD